ncbi:hypothetical protein [Streptomyces olivaceoviridis]|uniref:hypothetical protein n=1 Tax=Streptomyces olivaceoviridis TaxID=1921 RepID=UPI00332F1F25
MKHWKILRDCRQSATASPTSSRRWPPCPARGGALGTGRHLSNPFFQTGVTPVHYAAADGDANALKVLLAEGATPGEADTAGWTTLHLCGAGAGSGDRRGSACRGRVG